MPASVWLEEVNKGLMKEILEHVKCVDENTGDMAPLSEDSVIIRKSEEDFKVETYPCVSIYCRGQYHSPKRFSQEYVNLFRDIEKGTVCIESPAVPYDLSYQIDFWSKYQVDMDAMLSSWLFDHFRSFNLFVVDNGGSERTCNCIVKGGVIRSDLTKGTERLLHAIMNLEIWVELDEERRYNVPMVIKHVIDAKQKGR